MSEFVGNVVVTVLDEYGALHLDGFQNHFVNVQGRSGRWQRVVGRVRGRRCSRDFGLFCKFFALFTTRCDTEDVVLVWF